MDTEISFGGELSSNKGVNIPNSVLKISSVTKKDLRDLKLSVAMHADWIALSFIQKPEDIKKAKILEQILILIKLLDYIHARIHSQRR